jgi:hypothetical protein
MALAKYFDKNALAASQILAGYDRQSFEERLNNAHIEIAFDNQAVQTKEGTYLLDMIVRLASRLYPKVKFSPLQKSAESIVPGLSALVLSINDRIEINTEGKFFATIVVGNTPVNRNGMVFYTGSSGWLAKLSASSPMGSAGTSNPFGAGFAACLAMANIFRVVFHDQLINGTNDSDVCLSLIDFTHKDLADQSVMDIGHFAIPETFLIGLGAIGNGTIWALSKLEFDGELHLIDSETIDESNLQRYILATLNDVGRNKTDLAAEQFSRRHCIVSHEGDWASFLGDRQNWQLPLALVAVDSARDRISVQASLPAHIINAWTQPTDLGISRHPKFGELPCLSCIYPARKTRQSESELICGSFGLLELERDIRPLIYNNAPMPQQLLMQIATAKAIPFGELKPFEGLPIREFYHKVICGGMITVTAGNRHTETPMAFQSAMAGILLASELVTEALKLRREPISTMTRIDLTRPLTHNYSDPLVKDSSTNCVCNDEDFVSRYNEKYIVQ